MIQSFQVSESLLTAQVSLLQSVSAAQRCSELGEGITHTITGVYVMLTGVDTNGKQCHEFGSSEGNLKE